VNPSWSPDGRWLVFASNRDRRGSEATSLWLIEHRRGARPVRLTSGETVDRDPRFTPDGGAIIYASAPTSRGEATLDLWLQPVDLAAGSASGPPRRLTETADVDELSPSPMPDGSGVVYMAIDRASQRSTLHALPLAGGRRAGEPRRLTDGPFDATPSVSPDGRTIAFAAPVAGRDDTDLHAIDAGGGNRRVLVDDPLGDETGPAWSADGRWLFATSVIRSMEDGRPLMAALVCADLRERTVLLRALHDPAGVITRLGVAVGPRTLDATALHKNPLHRDKWRRILDQELERQRREAGGGGEP